MRHLLVLLGALALLALPAAADDEDWTKSCQSGLNTSSVRPGSFVCATFGDSSTLNGESKMLFVGGCDTVDIFFYPDIDGTADDLATAKIYSCGRPQDASGDDPPDAGWSATGLCWIIENTTLDGDPATNTEAIYGASATWIYALIATITDDDPQVTVTCNAPPAQ